MKHLVPCRLACTAMAMLLPATQAATYSLSRDFSYTADGTNSTWSYRLDDSANSPPAFPLLPSTNRDANALWGSDFPTPPTMWSEGEGYWGIGKNLTGREQISSKNGTRWAPGEVMFHPKGGTSPSGLVIGWRAPDSMVIDVEYVLARSSPHGNGIGYQLIRRAAGADQEIAALNNIGRGLTNGLADIRVAKGDQLFFRFDTCGEPTGDITRADINIRVVPLAKARLMAPQPSGGVVAAGTDLTLRAPVADPAAFQWRKDGQPLAGATNASHCVRSATMADAGAYSVLMGAVPSSDAILQVTLENIPSERYPSPVPRQVFPTNLAEQEAALKTNTLMLRFAASRKKLSADRHRPAYHFVSPESTLNDPNGLCFWQGRWHLFYQAYPPEDRRQHWGHTVSDDLVHWQDLPYAIYPGIERMCFSGSTVVEPQQVVAFYPGIDAGQMVAIAKDPLLLNWEKIKGNPVTGPGQPMGDSCIWKQEGAYYGLIGSRCLMTSSNLVDWRVANGSFLEGPAFPIDDGSCPNFQPIGDKHILLLFSHTRGGQYLLGDYDRRKLAFRPYEHGRFNHGNVAPAGVHAPSAAADGKGNVINILNINEGKPAREWDHLFSLAQELSLSPDKRLRIAPVATAAGLRDKHQHVGQTVLPANQEVVLKEIQGDALELDLEIDPQSARWVQLQVLRSPNAEEQTSVTFYNYPDRVNTWYRAPSTLVLDNSRASTLPDAWARPPEQVVLERGNEPLRLRVFVDRSVVEVFANGRRYLAMRVYPGRKDSLGVSLRAQGQDAVLQRLDAWQMKSIYQ